MSKKLDESIEFVDDLENQHSTIVEKESNLGLGIRLLNSSDTVICDEEENNVENNDFFGYNKRCKLRLMKDDSIPFKLKVKEAAVDAEWILSKGDTKAWFNRRKEAEFRYKKLQDGTLAEQ